MKFFCLLCRVSKIVSEFLLKRYRYLNELTYQKNKVTDSIYINKPFFLNTTRDAHTFALEMHFVS